MTEDGIGSKGRETPQHFAALRRRRELGHEPPAVPDERDKMFAGNSTLGTLNDLDNVLKILALVSDKPGETRDAVHHTRKLAVEFERLAKEQSEFAQMRKDHAARDKALTAREADLVTRENAVKAAEARAAEREHDLHRRLKILAAAAA